MNQPEQYEPNVHLDLRGPSLVIRAMCLTDEVVVREARHWTTGRRGPAVEDVSPTADLSVFLTEAVVLGSRALAAMGHSGESRAVEAMLREVGEKTASATGEAAQLTQRTVSAAVETMDKATAAAKRSITEAEERSRRELTAAVDAAQRAIVAEMQRTLGGENPALVERLRPLLDSFGTTVSESARAATDALLRQAVKQFDPADPTSPVAKLSTALAQQQEVVTARLDKNHSELTAAVTELATVVKIGRERSNVVKMTPLKGRAYEDSIGELMHEFAAGLGDEYEPTGSTVGLLPRSKRGDGVLHISGSSARLVIEMSDSPARAWGPYLDEAERNRNAQAALGVVRTPEQNGGQHIRVLGPRRVVLAFDPEHDQPDLLRTVVQLLRTAALAVSARTGSSEVATATEHIAAATAQLSVIDNIKKAASGIQKSGLAIEGDCAKVSTGIRRSLDLALAALDAAGADSQVNEASGAA
ncbi:Fis family transcriptional regulator [Blastococcus sp. CCUG 61487]|uniref:Fis family transcriptional regulator n=1 Tax=Blastococcus sp. CCUG 61487 TaxID=1840703 RepID=UPI0010C02C03|nr:Fis family transcriptional regulator [Blastococcus sp. CCUG 61487]TKJ28311.1 hypothetical protein A6V29_02605 [Blastococcus sp. CCUG 61487]